MSESCCEGRNEARTKQLERKKASLRLLRPLQRPLEKQRKVVINVVCNMQPQGVILIGMPFNGQSCIKDPITGYLTPTQQGAAVVFGSESKKRLLEEFEKCGNVAKACDVVGVSYQTMRDHILVDEAFARDYQIKLKRMEHLLEGTMFQKGQESNGTMDRFGWLRAHNPAKWNPKQQIVVSQDGSSIDDLFGKLKEQGSLIDVESSWQDSDSNSPS